MSNIGKFRSEECPRCGASQFFQLGDAHFTVTPLVEQLPDGAMKPAPDFTCYVKVCRNCAHAEFFSKFLIDDFQATEEALGSFGVITRAPGGQYLVSIFQTYQHRGQTASDFTVPIDADAWFQLEVALDDLSDEQVLHTVLYEPYLTAWKNRVGAVPPDLGKKLRALIRQYAEKQKGSSQVGM